MKHSNRISKVSRVGAIVGSAILATTLFTGCSASATKSAPRSNVSIVLHSNPSTDAALKTVAAGFEKANPSINVTLSFIPTNTYAATRTSRLAAKTVDIVEGAPNGTAAQPNPSYTVGLPESDWVKGVAAGQWVDLSKEPFMKDFQPSVVKALEVNGKSYVVPTALVDYGGVYYNKALFKKVGATVPKTWNQFVTVLKKLKAAGIAPLSGAGKDQWPIGLADLGLMHGQYPTTSAMQALDKGLWEGTAKLNDPKLVRVMSQMQTLYSYMYPNFSGVDYATAEGQFTGGQAAMTFDGTWAVQQFATQNPSLSFGYFPVPASNTASQNTALQGKLDVNFAIPSSSKNKAAAIKFLAYYSDPKNYAAYAKAGGIIPVEPNTPTAPVLSKVLGNLTKQPFSLAWDQIIHPNPKAGPAAAQNGINFTGLAPLGKLTTPQAAQDAAQADWAAGLSK